jgi:hypothetical protein
MDKDEDFDKRIDNLLLRLERHLEKLKAIEHLIENISNNKQLGEEIRKLMK